MERYTNFLSMAKGIWVYLSVGLFCICCSCKVISNIGDLYNSYKKANKYN